MKEDEYKADTPEAYLKSTYTARPKGQTDEVIKEEDAEEIVAKGAKLAAESVHSHKVPLHEEEKKSLVQKSKHHHKHNKKSHHHKQHTRSLANAPDYRISAWTEDQHDASHPKEWDQETKSTSKGYIQSLHQKNIEEHPYRTNAWNQDQYHASNEKEWHAETLKPSGYQVQPALYQKAKQIYPAKDQKSWIEPYSQRDHAWNMDQHDSSHEHEWHAET